MEDTDDVEGAAAPPSPRQRAHARTVREITRIAREQLATEGSAGLSLRAIARRLGIVSSAIYRYVPSRDELLTMLIVDAYTSLGEAAHGADRRCRRDAYHRRWMALGRAVRRWALERPTEYALLYGGPVPGYAAPERTVDPGTRVSALVVELLAAADHAGAIAPRPDLPIPTSVTRDLHGIKDAFRAADLDDEVLARGMLAWSSLFGLISFEVFGQFTGGISSPAAYFDHQIARLADQIGLSPD